MTYLDIHLEKIDDNGEKLLKLASTGKSLSLSLVPVLLLPEHWAFGNVYRKNYFYPERIVNILKEISEEKQIVWGQQGFKHYCDNCLEHNKKNKKKFRDPYHENKCLYKKSLSVDEQSGFMIHGKIIIEKNVGVSPELYVSPNHQSDKNSFMSSEKCDYKYFAVRDFLGLPVYREGNLIVLPERKFSRGGIVNYVHYDEMSRNFNEVLEMLQDSVPLSELEVEEKPKIKTWLNQNAVLDYKRARDSVALKYFKNKVKGKYVGNPGDPQ